MCSSLAGRRISVCFCTLWRSLRAANSSSKEEVENVLEVGCFGEEGDGEREEVAEQDQEQEERC